MSKKNEQAPIKWKLVEVDKKQIRPNPNNPKIRNEKGYDKLAKITKKFGVIFDGIMNADYSLIDGHSRLEQYPEGVGRYFVPDRQLSDDDEKELNALFDVARAGDPDMFMIEHILGDEAIEEWDASETDAKVKKKDLEAKYPLVPRYDEKYEAIVIMCTSSIDTTFIKDVLGIGKAMSYKNNKVKETSIITADQFLKKWKSK